MIRAWVWGVCLSLLACTRNVPLPDMQPGETGRVTKVIDGDGVILDTGQRVRLISITAPVLSARDHPPEPYSGESARLLEDLALGRRVQLFYPGLTRDRYDRALAHLVTIDAAGPRLWLNREMVARGAARVRLYSSTSARGRDLLQAETDARETQSGLWALADYTPRDASELVPTDRGFLMITARLGDLVPVAEDNGVRSACRRMLEDSQIIMHIDRDARSACGLASGTAVEVRGWLAEGALRLQHPLHLSLQDPP
ncbi:MAG: thermonuclease family protein [Pseudomonadota bacterium]